MKFLYLISLEEESFPNQKQFFIVRKTLSFFGNFAFQTMETKRRCVAKTDKQSCTSVNKSPRTKLNFYI